MATKLPNKVNWSASSTNGPHYTLASFLSSTLGPRRSLIMNLLLGVLPIMVYYTVLANIYLPASHDSGPDPRDLNFALLAWAAIWLMVVILMPCTNKMPRFQYTQPRTWLPRLRV